MLATDGHGRRLYGCTVHTSLFHASVDAQMTVAFIGGFTALMAALVALTQNDLKRILAYSTISQLGYMFLGLGAGDRTGHNGWNVPSLHPRILQGFALSWRGQCDARHGRCDRYPPLRWPQAYHAGHTLDFSDRLPHFGRISVAVRVLQQGSDSCCHRRTRREPLPWALPRCRFHSTADRLLHLPGILLHVLRKRRDPERGRTSRPRIAPFDDGTVGRPGQPVPL